MTYSYAGAGVTDKDTIRFLIQDTDPHGAGEWQVTDEEVQWSYDTWFPVQESLHIVAAQLAETIAARYAREASYSADGVSIGLGQVAQQYRELATSLRLSDQQLNIGGEPDVGGMAPDEQMLPGIKPFSFGKGMHDDVEAGAQEYGGVYPPDQTVYPVGAPHEQIVEP